MTEEIDQLADDELRSRLARYGFPNLPVTDTTRKVLVKKLKNAIENETSKNRRETVAVSKFSSDEEPEKESAAKGRGAKTPSRRATVAVTEKSSVKKLNGATLTNERAETPTKTPSRRTSRATPAKQGPTAVAVSTLVEDSDDDVIEIPAKRRSTSRTTTPTLGKSDTVRTSYKTSVDVVEENEDSSNVDEPSIEEESQPPRKPSPVFAQTASRRKTFTTSTSSYSTNLPEKPSPPKFGKSSLTTSYTRRGTYSFTQPEDDEEESMELNETNTPYLSNFAKRLSTLRAEPLDTGMDKYKKLSPRESGPSTSEYKSDYKASYATPSYGYKSHVAPVPKPAAKRGLMKDIGQIYDALDRQYNFRNILYIIFIVMIVVAIYVLFM